MDEVWRGRTVVRDQSGVWILWRGAGHEHEVEPECDAHGHEEFDLYELRDDARWRHLVGGHDGAGAGGVDGLAAASVDAEIGEEGGASECTVHHPGKAMSGDCAGVGR